MAQRIDLAAAAPPAPIFVRYGIAVGSGASALGVSLLAQPLIEPNPSVFYPPDDVADGKAARALDIARTRGRFEDEGWRLRKDGARFWANVVITALRDDQGQFRGFAHVTRDITERKYLAGSPHRQPKTSVGKPGRHGGDSREVGATTFRSVPFPAHRGNGA